MPIQRDDGTVLQLQSELGRPRFGLDIEVIARALLGASDEGIATEILRNASRARGVTEGAILASGFHHVCTVSFFLSICNQAELFVSFAIKRRREEVKSIAAV
jgi:hypothetical protein